MLIGGLQKFSLLDYPEHLSAIIFTQGCNFRCQFCYNPMLVGPAGKFVDTDLSHRGEKQKGHSSACADRLIKESDLFDFLKERMGKLDAVVITGGEPTVQNDLLDFIHGVKELGYKVKLDTNGTNPDIIEKLIQLQLVDYIAMDVKAPEKKYQEITGSLVDFSKIAKSVKIIVESGLPYEFRTTVVPELLGLDDIKKIGELIREADKWFLQQFKSDIDLVNNKFKNIKPYPEKTLEKMCEEARRYVQQCEVR